MNLIDADELRAKLEAAKEEEAWRGCTLLSHGLNRAIRILESMLDPDNPRLGSCDLPEAREYLRLKQTAWIDHTSREADAALAALYAANKRLLECVESLCLQFAYDGDGPSLGTAGLSALEEAFDVLGWKDPHAIPESRCDEPGCTVRATCGTPTTNGYRHTCGGHRP